jgi:hypothetical protein
MTSLPVIGLVVAAVAGCGAVSVVPVQDDLSTWQTTPLAPDQRLIDAALQSDVCRAGQDGDPPIQLLLQDRRTASTAAFLVAGPGFTGSCTITLNGGASGGSTRGPALEAMTSPIVVDERSGGGLGSGTATLLGGRAAPNVASVRIELADGTIVEASAGNGHWLAWWPGETVVVRITALDPLASIVAALNDSTPSWQQK